VRIGKRRPIALAGCARGSDGGRRGFAENLVAEAAKHWPQPRLNGIKECSTQYEHCAGIKVADRAELLNARCCPTCSVTVEDLTDCPAAAERWRKWDSCFTTGFLLYPRQQRALDAAIQISPEARAYWIDQFGISGLRGMSGRASPGAPVGIDITERRA